MDSIGNRRGDTTTRQAPVMTVEHGGDDRKKHNYKLIVDAFLRKGHQKLYRWDGVIPGDPTPVLITDPRSRVARLLSKNKQADLVLPQFIVDANYVGIPPPREVTFINLNDNINADFLRSMVAPFGDISECAICYHPKSAKHLGIAKVVFETTSAARACVQRFDQTSKMGSVMTVFTDPLGKERQGYLDEKVYDIPRLIEPATVPLGEELPKEPTIIPMDQVDHESNSHDHHISNDQPVQPPEPPPEDYPATDINVPPPFFDQGPPPTIPQDDPPYHRGGDKLSDRRRDSYGSYNHDRRDDRDRNFGRDYRDNRPDSRYDRGDSRDRRKSEYDREPKTNYERGSRRDYGNMNNDYNRNHRDDYDRDLRRGRDMDPITRGGRHDNYRRDRTYSRDSEYDRGRGRDRPDRGHRDDPRDLRNDVKGRNDEQRHSSRIDRTERHRERLCSTEETGKEHNRKNGDTDSLDLDARIQLMLTQNRDLAGLGSSGDEKEETSAKSKRIANVDKSGQSSPEVTHSHMSVPPPDVGYPPPPLPGESMLPTPAGQPPLQPISHMPNMGQPPPNFLGQMPSTAVPPPNWPSHVPYNQNGLSMPPPPVFHNGEEGMYEEDYHEYENESFDQYGYPPMEPLHISYDDALDDSVSNLIEELELVVKKDVQKKMVTQSAFKFFEHWWKESETRKLKESQPEESIEQKEEKPEAEPTSANTPTPIGLNNLSALFDKGSLFGIRSGVTKMPSFRRKLSPEREEALRHQRKREREQKEKKGKDDAMPSTSKEKKTPKRKPVESEKEDFSSSSDSEEDSSEESGDEEGQLTDSGDEDFDPKKMETADLSNSSSSSDSSSESSEESESEDERPIRRRKPLKKPLKKTSSKAVVESSSESESSSSKSDSGSDTESATEVPSEPETITTPKTQAQDIPEIVEKIIEEETMETETAVWVEEEDGAIDIEGEGAKEESKSDLFVLIEHNYSRPPAEAPALPPKKASVKKVRQPRPPKEPKENQKLKDITSKISAKGNRELASILDNIPTPKAKPLPATAKFEYRDPTRERNLLYEIFAAGVDDEDVQYLKRSYEKMLSSDDTSYDWCNDSHWVYHPETKLPDPALLPPIKKRSKKLFGSEPTEETSPHKTGSARTEGFYKISMKEKAKYLKAAKQYETLGAANEQINLDAKKGAQQLQREARSNQRRLATAFGDLDTGELLKFNQLKFRKKELRFSKSAIHDWGLFAMEPIPADTMVIEYVGALLRHSVADEREKQYERVGIGSSYLFRVDGESVIDATKCGNLARFVNHCCDANCYARVITVDGQKKIVIYSRRAIEVNEEITYDYKFPYEDEKIPCLCGAFNCRGTLN